MRKQYHFWPAGDGGDFDAWDVDRLIELSRELPVEAVPLDSIGEIDTLYWFDGSAENPTVRKVVEHTALILEADLAYPIILGHDGRVMDGMHRVARALMAGRSHIDAVRFSVPLEADYRNCQPRDLPY
ncbi:MAG: hypothetical protein M0Z30_05995 [Actinomycetota bacterium]|nr:hypothetical protein [Actinomycetota bacterium]